MVSKADSSGIGWLSLRIFLISFLWKVFFIPALWAEEIDYRYDGSHRLIQSQYTGIATEDYTYDGMGNRLTGTTTDSNSPANGEPITPTDPLPADGAQGVLSGVQLSWTGLDPDANDLLVYRIHFGSNSPPPLMHIQKGVITPPEHGLNSFTTYYWQVAVNDNRNAVTEGPIWQFTTGTNPPYAPSLLQPADQSEIRYLDILLTWTCQGDPNPNDTVSYDLYLGTTPAPALFQADITPTSFQFNGRTRGLNPAPVYYWRVVAKDNHGAETPSTIRSLTFIDSDGDNLPDDLEASLCTDPFSNDTDNDQIFDNLEDINLNGTVDAGETNPCTNDTDGDGMTDSWELGYGLDPVVNDGMVDSDLDGVPNYIEFADNTDPLDADLSTGSERIEDFETGDFSKFYWRTDPDIGWEIGDTKPFAGRYAAQSGIIGAGEQSSLETIVNCDAGQIRFFHRVSPESAQGRLIFYIDEVPHAEWTAAATYARAQFPVTAGLHTFRWTYVKGELDEIGVDGAWLDDIVFPGVPDTDDDGVIDGWEITHFNTLDQDLCGDADGDGINDLQAALVLADPIQGDSDGDGISDLYEAAHGLNPYEDDAWQDADGDGFSNYDEFIGNTDPNDADEIPRNVLEDFETGDLTKFYWRLAGQTQWDVSQDNPFEGAFAAKAPVVADGQAAVIETTIQCTDGPIAFRYAVSSEENADFLRFYIDGELQASWSGDRGYQLAVFPVSAGPHLFRWEYAKNASGAGLDDTAWIDNISFPGRSDTDNDGVIDGWELTHFDSLDEMLCADSNGDGVSDLQAALTLSDPIFGDTDADGMSDVYETTHGLNPIQNDAWVDEDGDGYANYDEFIGNTDPNDADEIPRFVLEDFETGDLKKFYWRMAGNGQWQVTQDKPFQGAFSAKAPTITDNQTATLETTIHCLRGPIAFRFSVSSEADGDFLRFYIDGALQESWSGDQAYQLAVYSVNAGAHTFRWEYAKNASAVALSDTAWIDNISFPASGDTDHDGVSDGWELTHFGTLEQDLCGDANGDGVSDLQAALVLADPIGGDTDGDGISDIYEGEHGLNLNQNDAWADADGDGYANYDEYIGDTDPNNANETPRFVLEDFESGDLKKFYWRLTGDAQWRVTQDKPYQGGFSAKAPAIADSQAAALQTTINCVNGPVAFRVSVSSEADADFLRFYIDGVLQQSWSGDLAYQLAAFPVTAGAHTFRWEYAKNASGTGLNDTAWIDNISFPGSGDSDHDGVIDGWELTHFGTLEQELCGDANGDGFSDLQAALVLADPIGGDTDGDGITDIYEVQYGLDPNENDAWTDADSDGYTNYDEFIGGTDPFDADDIPRFVLEDFETGDLSKFYWIPGGNGFWNVNTSNPYQGRYSAQSPVIGDSQSASLSTTIQCIQGIIGFWFSVGSEESHDWLRFYIDDILQAQWSGDLAYQFVTYPVSSGVHTFRWEYAKDDAGSQLEDSAWVDNISFPGSGDSDHDGVIDGWEFTYFGTLNRDLCLDSDGDGLSDLVSAMDLVAPYSDTDGDLLPDNVEQNGCTQVDDADSDDDGIPDGHEDLNHNGSVDSGETNPCLADTDGDGIQDGTESGLTLADIGPDTAPGVFVPDADPTTTTSPVQNDSDGDWLTDDEEDTNRNGAQDAGETSASAGDSDGDGYLDGFEVIGGTNPLTPDTNLAISVNDPGLDLLVQGTVTGRHTYISSRGILFQDATIATGAEVTAISTTETRLLPGTHIQSGAGFNARIRE